MRAEEIRPQQVGPQNPDLSWRWVAGIVERSRRGSPMWSSEKHVKSPTETTLGLSFLICETEIMLVLNSQALAPEPGDYTSGIHDVSAVVISTPRGQ